MPKRTSALALAGLVTAFAFSAAAQGTGPGTGPGAGQGSDQGMQRFQSIDTNGDGQISGEEHAMWRFQVFTTMDADDSLDITKEEYMAVRMGKGADPDQQGPKAAEREQAKEQRFAKMDNDQDGKVSRARFVHFGGVTFAAADKNGDGLLTLSEFRDQRWGL